MFNVWAGSPNSPWLTSLRLVASAVLVPIKSFDLAKGRLAEAVPEAERAKLARTMAATVLAASKSLSTWVICGDPDVAAFAVKRGANVIWREPRGLNHAATEGVEVLQREGFDRAIVCHADLPLATDLTWLADSTGVVVVPDRRNDGSNVLCLPTNAGFCFGYGPGSAAAHRVEADRLGLRFQLAPNQELGWDVDLPEDLIALRSSQPWLPTYQACEATP